MKLIMEAEEISEAIALYIKIKEISMGFKSIQCDCTLDVSETKPRLWAEVNLLKEEV